jgi:hypothetical protein
MPITIQCPGCESRVRAPDSVEGRPVTCPKCGNHFTAVASPEPPAAPAVASAKAKDLSVASSSAPSKTKSEPAVPVKTRDSSLGLAPAPAKSKTELPAPTAASSEPPIKLENWAEIATAPPELPPEKEDALAPPAPRAPNVLVDFLLFRRMIAPVVIQIFFWFGFIGCVLFGGLLFARVLTMLQKGDGFGPVAGYLFGTLAVWFLGPLVVRVACEVLILFFRMNDTLIEIKKATQELPDEEP